VSRPLREKLEVCSYPDGEWIRCTRCTRVLSRAGEDWRAACTRRLFEPTDAGPLMNILGGRYVFEKLYCPGCAALLNAEMVEDKK
jgi:hypothetical protein